MLERFKEGALNCLPAALVSIALLTGCTETKPQARPTFGFYPSYRGHGLTQFNLTFDPGFLDGVSHYTEGFDSRGYFVEVDLARNEKHSIFEVTINDPINTRSTDRARLNIGSYKTNLRHTLSIYWSGIIQRATWDNQPIKSLARISAENPN